MTAFFVGTSGWTYDHWKGIFYPEKLARARWFAYYAEIFRAVEINATFYRAFGDAIYLKWREQVQPAFRYVLKAPKSVTHEKLLVEVGPQIAAFWRSAGLLGERLGGVLLQVSPATPYDLGRLRAALLAFGDPRQVAVEFRAEAWERPAVRQLLEELGTALVNVDSPGRRPAEWVTGRLAYLRLHGRGTWYASNYSDPELDEITGLAQRMAAHGAQEVYIFFNNDLGGYAPHNARVLMERLES